MTKNNTIYSVLFIFFLGWHAALLAVSSETTQSNPGKKGSNKKSQKNNVCLMLSKDTKNVNIMRQEFGERSITFENVRNLAKLTQSTNLSKYSYIIIDDPNKIQERFARHLETWVGDGGVLIVTRMPNEYSKISFTGKKITSKVYTVPWVHSKLSGNGRNTLLRATSVVDYASGKLIKISIPKNSALYQLKSPKAFHIPLQDDVKCGGLALVTGWKDRSLGDMMLVEAEIANSKTGLQKNVAVVTRYFHGRGMGIRYKLPLTGKNDSFEIIRRLVIDFAVKFKPANPDEIPSVFSKYGAPGKHLPISGETTTKFPKRAPPPQTCIMELQGDQFSCGKGSPSWAPWRIAIINTPHLPAAKIFKLPATKTAIWMEIKAANGDHTDPPRIEIRFNGITLSDRISPWNRIQYNKKYYASMRTQWIYLPRNMIRTENKLEFIDHGPDWWLLDYVCFYEATGKNALTTLKEKDISGKNEVKVAPRSSITLDGKLDEKVWKHADWKFFEKSKTSGNSATAFALVNGENCLYVGFKCPYGEKVKMIEAGNIVEFSATWPGSNTNYIFAYRCNGTTSLRSVAGDIVLGSTHQAAHHVNTANKIITVEMAIPWQYLSVEYGRQFYRPTLRRWMPYDGIMSVNAFRRVRGQGDRCEWSAWLPFMRGNKERYHFERLYKTKEPYHCIYNPMTPGMAYALNGPRDDGFIWPKKFKWGTNIITPSTSDIDMLETQVVFKGAQVFESKSHAPNIISFPIVLNGLNDIIIKTFDSKNHLKRLAIRSAQIEMPCMALPGKSFYTTEKTANITFKIHDPVRFKDIVERIDGEITLPGGGVERFELNGTNIKASHLISIPFNISSLPIGSYTVTLHISVAGERIALKPITLNKLPPSQTEVKIRSDGVTEINGKPFFPFGICLTAFEMNNSVDVVREAGINFVIPWGGYSGMTKKSWDTFLDEAHKNKVYVAVNPTEQMNGAGEWLVNYDKTAKFTKFIKKHSAIFGYYPIDEPEYWHSPNCTPRKLKEFNNFIRKLDPYRPNMISHAVGNIHYGKSGNMVFNDAIDIRIWECYSKPSDIFSRMDEMKGIGKNDQITSWAFLRTGTGWNCDGMSPLEFRANAYAAIIAECKGIVYFEMRTARWTGHELWPTAFKQLSEEVKLLSNSFMKRTSKPILLEKLTGGKNTRAKAWIDGNSFYLIAVNADNQADKLKIRIPFKVKGDGLPIFSDMPTAQIDGKTLSISLSPYSCGAYTMPFVYQNYQH